MPFAALGRSGPAARVAGWYGKIPSRGDFVSRGLAREQVSFCDRWLWTGLAKFRDTHASDTWRERYESAPVWTGLLPRSLVRGAVALLVVGPSRDRVGRPFPICLLLSDAGTPDVEPLAALAGRLTGVVRASVEDELEPEAIDALLADATAEWLGAGRLRAPAPGRGEDILAALGIDGGDDAVTVPLNPDASPWPDLAARFHPDGELSYWWTAGTRGVPRALEHAGGLDGNLFCAMFDYHGNP